MSDNPKNIKPYKRLLTIQDISCVGQCSLTVALPILSACGHETAVLPSAVLSCHTAFNHFSFRDLTEDMPIIGQYWNKENIKFDAFYIGYLGNLNQIHYVKNIMKSTANANSLKIIDPAMADDGKLYTGFDNSYVEMMRKLCEEADYLLPNVTELCLLTDTNYQEEYEESYIDTMLSKLKAFCSGTIILTGVNFAADYTGVIIYDSKNKSYYKHKKLPQNCHGTGDVFASTFTGVLLKNNNVYKAVEIACDYTLTCMIHTIDDKSHWYGTKFETTLPDLILRLSKDN